MLMLASFVFYVLFCSSIVCPCDIDLLHGANYHANNLFSTRMPLSSVYVWLECELSFTKRVQRPSKNLFLYEKECQTTEFHMWNGGVKIKNNQKSPCCISSIFQLILWYFSMMIHLMQLETMFGKLMDSWTIQILLYWLFWLLSIDVKYLDEPTMYDSLCDDVVQYETRMPKSVKDRPTNKVQVRCCSWLNRRPHANNVKVWNYVRAIHSWCVWSTLCMDDCILCYPCIL